MGETERKPDNVQYALDIISSDNRRHTDKLWQTVFVLIGIIIILIGVFIGYAMRTAEKMNAMSADFNATVIEVNQRWIDYLSQYDFETLTETYTQDGRGLNIIGDQNGVNYNGADLQENDAEQNAEGREIQRKSNQ